MTVFKESQLEDPGTWFPYFSSRFDVGQKKFVYDDPVPGAARFRIRSSVPFHMKRQSLQKRRSEYVLNTHTKMMERVSYPEDPPPEQVLQEREDLYDYVVTGIEGAKWDDGRPIECTRENKLKLFINDEFDRFVGKCLTMLAERAEASEKN